MQLVLVAGFNTKVAKTGPRVRIYEGKWRFVVEGGGVDIALYNEHGHIAAKPGQEFLSEGGVYWFSVDKSPVDNFITAFVEYIRDPKPTKSA